MANDRLKLFYIDEILNLVDQITIWIAKYVCRMLLPNFYVISISVMILNLLYELIEHDVMTYFLKTFMQSIITCDKT